MELADLTLVSAPPSPKYGPPLPEQDTRSQQQHGQSQAQAQAHAQLQLQAQARAQAQAIRQAPTRPWKSVYCERLAIARNWARGKCSYKTLKGHTDAITCLQIDDSLHDVPYPVLMTGSWDRTVRIWNAETGMCVSELRGHTRGVRCIQFDSAKLISGGMDSTLKIWSWRTGQCIRTLEGHRDSVISLCFDKHVLASGSADSTIKVGPGTLLVLLPRAKLNAYIFRSGTSTLPSASP
jgi:F-box/WD-40 domain protein MET30